MGKKLNFAQKIRGLSVGKHFLVDSEKERQDVCKIAKNLRDAGVIEFQITTRRWYDGKFKVSAI